MNIHENARTTPASRELLVRRILRDGWSPGDAARAAGISRQTAYKWLRRFQQDGAGGLRDRSSRAHCLPHSLPPDWGDLVEYLRHFRQTARLIGHQLGLARSTVSATLARRGLGPQRSLEPVRPPCRYERRRPGDLLHLDIKKLARFWRPGHRVTANQTGKSRGAGWEFVHVAIDDHSRSAPWPGLPSRALPSSGCSPTTAPDTTPTASAKPASPRACGTCVPSPTPRRPTARPSDSSKRCSGSGPTAVPTTPAHCVRDTSRGGWTSTITKGPMLASTTYHPSADGRQLVNNGRRNHT